MSFGSTPSTPAADPVVPTPQKEDPSSYRARTEEAAAAAGRDGYAASLLTGFNGVAADNTNQPRRLLGAG